jgi:hypothetical protein
MTEAHLREALDILDHVTAREMATLRAMALRCEERARAAQAVGTDGVRTDPAAPWDPVCAAMLFVVWTTSNVSLARSL